MTYDAEPQPPPQSSTTPAIWPMVISLLEANRTQGPLSERLIEACKRRDAFGRKKYGMPLTVQNGRGALPDALDEALDAMAYTYQHKEQVHTPASVRLFLAATDLALAILEELEPATADAP